MYVCMYICICICMYIYIYIYIYFCLFIYILKEVGLSGHRYTLYLNPEASF